jgi:hypothetical protein
MFVTIDEVNKEKSQRKRLFSSKSSKEHFLRPPEVASIYCSSLGKSGKLWENFLEKIIFI